MTWLVTWIFVNTFMVTCPINMPQEDPYRGLVYSDVVFAVACWDTNYENKGKYFDSYEEAKAFVDGGEGQSDLTDFVIEEVDTLGE
jgi:hypothetical protein